jgi:transcriptional regulator with XRE-family HTH domain
MDQNTNQKLNRLAVYRRRMGFSQKQVSGLIGHPDTSMISRYERGLSFPPLSTALKLEIVYRVPVAFLYPSHYEGFRERIRAQEEILAGTGQRSLFAATSQH